MKRSIIWILSLVILTAVEAQQYNFINLNVEHGLIQSQANALCQDKQGHLWIGTMGGLSRYDGQKFTSYSMNDGLPSNPCLSLLCDRQGYIWVGTQNGLSCYNGLKFRNYFFAKAPLDNRVQSLAEDHQGRIWCIVRNKLYCVNKHKVTAADLPQDQQFRHVVADKKGQIWAGGPNTPLYSLQQNQWKKMPLPAGAKSIKAPYRLLVDPDNQLWLLTKTGLYVHRKGIFEQYNPPGLSGLWEKNIRRLAFDQNKRLWVATHMGLYQIRPEGVRRYDHRNGFSQNLVMDILLDREQQLWFAMAGGDGIFRYAGDTFEHYDESTGLPNASVMSICRDSAQQIWIGTFGGGLGRLGKKGFESLRLPIQGNEAQRINGIIADHRGMLWIATEGLGLWTYQKGRFQRRSDEQKLSQNALVLHLHQDHQRRIWMGSSQGVLRFENDSFRVVKKAPFVSTCFLSLNQDSVIMGSTSGIYLMHADQNIMHKQPALLQKSTVICAARRGNFVWIGSDNGLFRWDLSNNQFKHYNQKSGLPSNIVYNLSLTANGILYAGTGQGFTRLVWDASTRDYQIDNFSSTAGIPNWESNQHASLVDRDGSIWFGTTKGLYHYGNDVHAYSGIPAEVLLQSVKLFSKPLAAGHWNQGLNGGYNIPLNLRLPPRKNHLSFEFSAISLRDPQGLQYQYRIVGLDTDWSTPSSNRKVEYPNLPAGKFFFEARARTKNGQWVRKSLHYPFEIITPFYQTIWFRVCSVSFLVLLGVAIQSFRVRLRLRRKRQMDHLRQEEQEKVRRRTAEDFHDELGNKLTRIALLTEILQNKLNNQQPEVKNIVRQIKDNTVQLYGGARDIIWSLNPSSDNLYEILIRIRDFGVDLLADTGIDFTCEGIQNDYQTVYVPIDYSRNLIMIFKEALTNCLKHSQAKMVLLEVMPLGNQNWRIILRDDGQGFCMDKIKKGHGIDNMMVRAKRIEAQLEFAVLPLGGTRMELRFTLKNKP